MIRSFMIKFKIVVFYIRTTQRIEVCIHPKVHAEQGKELHRSMIFAELLQAQQLQLSTSANSHTPTLPIVRTHTQ